LPAAIDREVAEALYPIRGLHAHVNCFRIAGENHPVGRNLSAAASGRIYAMTAPSAGHRSAEWTRGMILRVGTLPSHKGSLVQRDRTTTTSDGPERSGPSLRYDDGHVEGPCNLAARPAHYRFDPRSDRDFVGGDYRVFYVRKPRPAQFCRRSTSHGVHCANG
jgi:hypothetical protein